MSTLRQNWLGVTILASCLFACPVSGESAVDLLSGFDVARIEAAFPPANEESIGELAKLAYRVQAADGSVLASRVGIETGMGDAVSVEGKITKIQRLAIPESLVEFLDFAQLQLIDVSVDPTRVVRVVAVGFPAQAVVGDSVSGVGVAVEFTAESRLVAVVASRLEWFPRSTSIVGWQILGDAGMDVGLLAGARVRSRQPLMAEDADAFYTMLLIADQIGQSNEVSEPEALPPVSLLKQPESLIGQWLRMNLETVQVTRISVTQGERQAQLGTDHYYQIDAVADIGPGLVEIERADGNPGPTAIFQNRYPVSVVTLQLPEFLRQRVVQQEGGDAVLSQFRSLIRVDAFFYRLWAYETDYMKQYGGGDQFGPLLIAARMEDREPKTADPAGVQLIGWIAAGGVIAGILFFWFWGRIVSARDAAIRRRRRDQEAQHLQLP